jgi:RNA polymerase sigma factor (sigma-70 family)
LSLNGITIQRILTPQTTYAAILPEYMNSPDDNEVMTRIKEGDVGRLNILFSRYHGMLTGYFINQSGNRELAKDLTQDTFWRILRYRSSFSNNYPFKSWMFRIARNVYTDHCKASNRQPVSFDSNPSHEIDENPSGLEACERDEEHLLLHQALSTLPEDKREILFLARFENLNYREIAALLDCSVNNVKIKVFRALQQLRDQYQSLANQKAS